MGTPARTNILLDIQSVLGTITVVNGYKTTVVTVEPTFRSRDDVSIAERPYLAFGLGKETVDHDAFNTMRVVAPLVIVGLVSSSSWTTRSELLNKLIDDVVAALSADPQRNSNAISTYFKGWETDEADPDAGADGGACIIEGEIHYYRSCSAS